MKKRKVLISAGVLFFSVGLYGQTFGRYGINTNHPAATLDVGAVYETGTSTEVDGTLFPRVDRQRAQSMRGVPLSTMIYVNSITTGTATGTAANIDATGFYYFNGMVWTKLIAPAGSAVNLYNSDGALTGDRTVTQGDKTLAFTGTKANAFSVDGTTFSVDAANDRVGIGTSAPAARLHVDGGESRFSTGTSAWALAPSTGGTTGSSNSFEIIDRVKSVRRMVFNDNGDVSLGGGLSSNSAAGHLSIRSGNVGIDTGTPQKKLHVNGAMQLTNELNVGGNGTSAGSAGTVGQVLTSKGAGAAPEWKASPAGDNMYNTDGSLTGNRIVTQADKTLAFTGTKANAFSVDGNTFSVDAANDRVGIGTVTPQTKLDIVSGNNSYGIQHSNGTVNLRSYIGTDLAWLGTQTDHGLNLMTKSTAWVRIQSNGYMGVGTVNPQKRLHVNGALQVTNELNVGGTDTTAGSAGSAGQVLTSNGAGAAPSWKMANDVKGTIAGIYYAQGTSAATIPAGSTQDVPGVSITLTVPAGTTRTFMFTVSGYANPTTPTPGQGTQGSFSLLQNGTKISSAYASSTSTWGIKATLSPTTLLKAVTLSAGTYTFKVQYSSWFGSQTVNRWGTDYTGYNNDPEVFLTKMNVLVYNN